MKLLSGFEPFKDFTENPSQLFVESIEIRNTEKIILPVEYEYSFFLLKTKIDQIAPRFVIMFGLAQSRENITLERYGYNHNDCTLADNKGLVKTNQIIIPNRPDKYETTISLQNSFNWEISEDPGRYVCNDLYFRTLDYTRDKNIQCIFIHLPLILNTTMVNNLHRFIEDL